MKLLGEKIKISATDLSNHLACRYLTSLDLQAARGEIKRAYRHDPSFALLVERGNRHELDYLGYLKSTGLNILDDQDDLDEEDRLQRTIDAMKSGVPVIAQADLRDDRWRGRADVLLKVDAPSKLGNWSYEVVDTKLARETRGGTILQLCLYSELVGKIQGFIPEKMSVITPGKNFEPEIYRTHDYQAYYRFVKKRLEEEISSGQMLQTYPEPVEHCDVCSWWEVCNGRRRKDDHLSFVAGISKLQITELRKMNVNTLAALASTPLPIRADRGSSDSFEKIREQARLQFQSRVTEKPIFELLEVEPDCGLARLPEPDSADIFFDFESDPFYETDGIEYLLGYVILNQSAEQEYTSLWGLNRISEREAFESFIDFVMERWNRNPGMHIYHFTHYEQSALKRLAGRYSSREDELDRMLRAELFVDLYRILKQTLRASVETYSLKEMEKFFGFDRKIDLETARQSLRYMESALELDDVEDISEEIKQYVAAYNRDDCISTLELRNWLEQIRDQEISSGKKIERPQLQPGDPSEAVDERRKRVLALMDRLLDGIPEEPALRTPEQQANWLIAYLLEWHRREDKATWWEYFRLRELTDEELFKERNAISGLEFVERLDGGTPKCPIDRYRFPLQGTELRERDSLETSKGKFGQVDAINKVERTIDIKKRGDTADVHPQSVFGFDHIQSDEQAESLLRLATWIADHAVDADGQYRAGRDLLVRNHPRLRNNATELGDDAKSLVLQLDHTILPIQGPPGSGKTSTGARMICELIRAKKKIGITAMSHKVIRKLLGEVLKAAKEENLALQCIQRVPEKSEQQIVEINETDKNDKVLDALQNDSVHVAAGTSWLWSREEFAEAVDVLFVDEAGQMSLADVLAVSQAAKSVVLLGDPRQLDQPLQGTHPPGVAVSALQHILGEEETMPENRGLFMKHTWRLAPSICKFTSDLFYDGRLQPREKLKNQRLEGPSRFAGAGLFFIPVEHEGNQNSSDEEADVVAQIVQDLLQSGMCWVDKDGVTQPLKMDDILIVTPYNAQMYKLYERLPSAHIGTVDKFQGQQAPVVIYSMTTSTPEEAPRGMEFLYSLNRFNVATSRAKCVCILVASPRLFEPECKTPRQMKLANALCRYLELSNKLKII